MLSRILDILGKTAFCKEKITFANTLRQGFLQIPKDPMQWDDAVARHGEAGTALMILLYYHYQGTQEYETVHCLPTSYRVSRLSCDSPVIVGLHFQE